MDFAYLVRYGLMRRVGRFAAESDAFERGQTVVVRSLRGLELGEVLLRTSSDAVESEPTAPARVLRAAGPDDLDQAQRAESERPERLRSCERAFRDGGWPLQLIDVEPMLDGRRAVLHYLGPHRIDADAILPALRAACGLDVLLEPAGLDIDFDPEPDTDEGCGSCGTGGGGCGLVRRRPGWRRLLRVRGQGSDPDQALSLAAAGLSLRRGPGRATLLHGLAVMSLAMVAILGNTRFDAPPRFDGAGYAVLARSLAEGRGYREIDHPDAPPHAHYPPGYPLGLAGLWTLTGPSTRVAHGFSFACALGATLAAWLWFRRLYSPRVALLLGLALALNWAWTRTGGAIQSEPLYTLLAQSALLVAGWAGRRGGIAPGLVLGVLLGACALTRHVGVAFGLALGLDLLWNRRVSTALAAGLMGLAIVSPWVAWLVTVRHNTQVALLARGDRMETVVGNALFYARRLPDQLSGPFVEAATVFGRSRLLADLATAGAVLMSVLLIYGWARTLRSARRRLAGLVPLLTLGVLLAWPFTEAGRFLVPLTPMLLIGAVEGLAGGISIARPSLLRIARAFRVAQRPTQSPSLVGRRTRPPRSCKPSRIRARSWAAGLVLAAGLPYGAYRIVADRAGAQERTFAGFDAACAWIADQETPAGPVLARQAGEVYWLTDRPAIAPPADDPPAIDRAIDRYGIAFLLVDGDRYARAPTSPLGRYARARPDRVGLAWSEPGGGAVAVYVVRSAGANVAGAKSVKSDSE